MYTPLKVTTDYSLLKSLIKIDDLLSFLKEHNISSCAICDDYLYGVMEFYNKCRKNNIKPIIGLDIVIANQHLYLYAMDLEGYQNLLKINTLKSIEPLTIDKIKAYIKKILVILPYESISIYNTIKMLFSFLFIGFSTQEEKEKLLTFTKNIVYVNDIRALKKEDTPFLNYLKMIEEDKKLGVYEKKDFSKYYYKEEIKEEDQMQIEKIVSLLNLEFPKNESHIPIYDKTLKDSYLYLETLTKKGLQKRLKNEDNAVYNQRLAYELSVIKNMGFVDYILIVYDYVLFAKKNHIFVGPGRGSAAGSLVCYTLGITDIDPIKYNLLFERFLNPERITMPDIDIDFENTKREQVIDYIKNRYGIDKVASIITFATLKSKLALREVARILNKEDKTINNLLKEINSVISLKENLHKKEVKERIEANKELQKIYKIALKIEGLKKNISTHAAGVVISNIPLDEIIPIIKVGNNALTGITMEYLEELGLLKMDLLAIKNLTMIQNILELIKKDTGKTLDLNRINLNDETVMRLFTLADTTGIFQFESNGMRCFLQKLKPRHFNDLVASIALYRPGPMDNINTFIRRKEGKEKVNYMLPILKPILEETEGIIVYQEQVMQILVHVANYSYAEADIIRRAMSKKKKEIILSEEEKFISRAQKNGYDSKIAKELYNLILKFAGYGFNKSHSVSYSLIGYQMAYLKVKFPTYFITNLLNISIGSEIKTKEYIIEAKKHHLEIEAPLINKSREIYEIEGNKLFLPLSIIKGINKQTVIAIIEERNKEGIFKNFFDFVARMYQKNCNDKIIEILINAGVFREFGKKSVLLKNLDRAVTYAFVKKRQEDEEIPIPILKDNEKNGEENSFQSELACFGFYITNHPTSIYCDQKITKIENIASYFDKYVKCVVLIENIKKIKTKGMQDMAFIEASDETGILNFVLFSKQIRLLENLKHGDIVEMQGRVAKRYDEYQININNIIKME